MTLPSLHSALPLALLLTGLAATTAQALSFGVGPKVGANFGSAEIDNVEDVERRTGLALGAMAEFGVTDPLSLVLEPMYLQRGARFDILGARARGDLDYFEIPILAKAKFGDIRTAHAFLFLGPSLGILTASEGRYLGFEDAFEEEFAQFTFAFDVGAGVAYRIARYVYLSADLRYSHGFTDAMEGNIGAIDDWHHRDIRAAGAILFHLME